MNQYQSSIDNYYATNYTKCPKNTSLLASWQGFTMLSHICAVILIPIYIYGGYCIIKITPVAMKQTKWFLFNLHFWVSYTDVLLLTLLTPYFFLPAFSGFPMGLFQIMQVPIFLQVYAGVVSIQMMMLSIAVLFENRFTTISRNSLKISKFKKLILYGVQIFFILTHLIPIFIFLTPNQEETKYHFLTIAPCPTQDLFDSPVFFFVALADRLFVFNIIVGYIGGIIFIQIIFFCCGCVHKLFFSNVTISRSTRILQRNYFFGTLLQVAVPALFVAFPICGMASMGAFNYYNQELTNCCTLALSIHGLMSTLVMIGVHKPYREHTANILLRRVAKKPIEPKISSIPFSGR